MKKIILTSAVVLGLFALAAPAHSTAITYDLDFEFSGGDDPAGPAPWVSLTFDDGNTPGSVDLTISTAGLTADEIMAGLYINFDPALDVNDLVFTLAGGNEAIENSISLGENAFKAAGGGYFDIKFNYPPPGEPPGNYESFFAAQETVAYTITLAGITASSFDFFSAPSGGNGTYHAAAKIQRIGENTEGSGWIGDNGAAPPVPEPATMVLFGVGSALVGFSRRRKK